MVGSMQITGGKQVFIFVSLLLFSVLCADKGELFDTRELVVHRGGIHRSPRQ